MYVSPNMGLTVWNLLSDLFDHTALEGNFNALDIHDHSSGKGVQIPTGGIANGAVTNSKLATGAVTSGSISSGSVGTTQLADGSVTDAKIAAATITGDKIASATITWDKLLSVLDAVQVSANHTAANLEHVIVSGGTPLTVTLPAAVGGTLVAISGPGSSVSGSNPVTVASGGAQIFGRGLGSAGASSLLLGTQGAGLLLQCEGSYWSIIAGEQDTGWVDLTLSSGWTAGGGVSSVTPALRLRGNTVSFRGAATNGTGLGNAGPFSGTIPSVFQPASTVGLYRAFPDETGTMSYRTINIHTTIVLSNNVASGAVVPFDGLQYAIN